MDDILAEIEEEKKYKPEILDRLKKIYNEEWEASKHNENFEAWGELYYKRFGRLRPGKSDPLANSSDPKNMAQYWAWKESWLAQFDAIREIVKLKDKIARMEEIIEELQTGQI